MYLVSEYGSYGNEFTASATEPPIAVRTSDDESLQSKIQSDRLLVLQLQRSKQVIEEMLKCLDKRIIQMQISVQETHLTKDVDISEFNSAQQIVSSISLGMKHSDNEKAYCNSDESNCTVVNQLALPLPQRNSKNAVRNQQLKHSSQNVAAQISLSPAYCINAKTQSTDKSPVIAPNRTETVEDVSQPKPPRRADAALNAPTSTTALTQPQVPPQSSIYTKVQLQSTMPVPIESPVHTKTREASRSSNTQMNTPKNTKATGDTSILRSHAKAASVSSSPAITIPNVALQVPKQLAKDLQSATMSSQSHTSAKKATEGTEVGSLFQNPVQAVAACGSTTLPVKKFHYPPIIVEILPNRLYHINQLKMRLGKDFKVRTFGKTVKFVPEKGYENRVIKWYLTELEKTENISWFIYPTSTVS